MRCSADCGVHSEHIFHARTHPPRHARLVPHAVLIAQPREYLDDEILNKLVANVESGPFIVSKARLLASCTAALLEMIEQNRDQSVHSMLEGTLTAVHSSLVQESETKQWD